MILSNLKKKHDFQDYQFDDRSLSRPSKKRNVIFVDLSGLPVHFGLEAAFR